MIARHEIIAAARREVANGTPWRHQQALLGVALDCIGLIAAVARVCGSEEAEQFFAQGYRTYGIYPEPAKLRAACAQFMDPIKVADALPADVFVMRFEEEPQHFGFLSALPYGPSLIHTWAMRGKVVEHALDVKWQRRVLTAWRLRGIGPWQV